MRWWVMLKSALVLALVVCGADAAARRVALVIGNAAYAEGPLRNPVNDARLMEGALKDLGFAVDRLENADFQRMQRAIRQFGNKAQGAEVALVFFAGHGIQADGDNYLLPVGAQIDKEADLASEAVTASAVLRQVEASGARIGLVILDACRNNPFRARTRGTSRGLGRIDAPAGSIVAFSAQPNAVADDGNGDNGLYTAQLVRQLRVPDLDIRQVFERTALAVERESGGRQRPREDIGLRGPFSLSPAAGGAAAAAAPAATVAVAPAPSVRVQTLDEIEQAYWDAIRTSTDLRDFQDYLRRYPNGRFAALAERQVRLLGSAPPAAPAAAPVTTPPATVAAPAPDPVAAPRGAYPTRPVRLVVPFTAGGSTDMVARSLADALSRSWGQPVVVDNKPGAGGMIGAQATASSPADGYTLLLSNTTVASAGSLFSRPAYRLDELRPVARIANSPLLVVTSRATGMRSLADLSARMRRAPVDMATSGTGSIAHFCAVALGQQLGGSAMTVVPYKGTAPAIVDLLANQVQVMCVEQAAIKPQVDSGALVVLASVGSAAPGAAAPAALDLPSWLGLFAPAQTPQAVVDQLAQSVARLLQDGALAGRLAQIGLEVPPAAQQPSAPFSAAVNRDAARFADLVRVGGIKAD